MFIHLLYTLLYINIYVFFQEKFRLSKNQHTFLEKHVWVERNFCNSICIRRLCFFVLSRRMLTSYPNEEECSYILYDVIGMGECRIPVECWVRGWLVRQEVNKWGALAEKKVEL